MCLRRHLLSASTGLKRTSALSCGEQTRGGKSTRPHWRVTCTSTRTGKSYDPPRPPRTAPGTLRMPCTTSGLSHRCAVVSPVVSTGEHNQVEVFYQRRLRIRDAVVSYKRVSRRYEVVQILPVQRHVRAAHQTVLLTNPSRCTRLTLLAVQYFQYLSSAFACMGITHSIRNSFEMRSNLYHLTVASPHRFTQSRHQRVAHSCCCLATGG